MTTLIFVLGFLALFGACSGDSDGQEKTADQLHDEWMNDPGNPASWFYCGDD